MNNLKVKIKKCHPLAQIPKYAKPGDAGLDIVATSKKIDEYGNIHYGTGLAFEIPEGYFMMLLPRSSNAKTDLMLTNHCGVVDSGFRSEVSFKYATVGKEGQFFNPNMEYEVGDRVGQAIIMPFPHIEFDEVEELSASERGHGSYGSTGR